MDGKSMYFFEDVAGEFDLAFFFGWGKGVEVVHDSAVVDDFLDVAVATSHARVLGVLGIVEDLLHLF